MDVHPQICCISLVSIRMEGLAPVDWGAGVDAVPISNRHWHVPGEQLLSLRGTSLWFENFGMCLLCQNSAPTMNIGTFSYSCLFQSCSKNQIKLFKMFKRYRKCAKWKSCWRFSKRKMLSHLPRPIYGWFLLPQEEPAVMAFLAIYIILVFIFLMFLGTTRSCLRPSSQFNGDSFYGETWFITVANLTINGISPMHFLFCVLQSPSMDPCQNHWNQKCTDCSSSFLQIKPMIFAWKSTLGEL